MTLFDNLLIEGARLHPNQPCYMAYRLQPGVSQHVITRETIIPHRGFQFQLALDAFGEADSIREFATYLQAEARRLHHEN